MNLKPTLATFLLTTALLAPLPAQVPEPAAKAEAKANPAEAAFTKMLTNATLDGTWAPIDKKALGLDQDDKYHITKVQKTAGNKWLVFSRMKMQGREVEFPIPVVVEFAGDAAVMILDNVPIGPGQVWSARVLFHDDVYVGSWWGADKAVKSGIISGTITRDGE